MLGQSGLLALPDVVSKEDRGIAPIHPQAMEEDLAGAISQKPSLVATLKSAEVLTFFLNYFYCTKVCFGLTMELSAIFHGLPQLYEVAQEVT